MKIHRHTVNDMLWQSLMKLMKMDVFANFRLVGGTALSLMIGHRTSVDIDLFTDSEYGSVNFIEILKNLKAQFECVDHNAWHNKVMGNSCFIGSSPEETIKLDLYYMDPLIYPIIHHENIRMASQEEIVAMKLDVIGRGGRKKDFWDIHAMLDHFDLPSMLEFYTNRYPYNFNHDEIIAQLINFENAESDPDPNCLNGKYWELIKLDFEELIHDYDSTK